MTSLDDLFIHFETLSSRSPVFRMTEPLIADAKARSKLSPATSISEDLRDLSWLSRAIGLVTHNDVLIRQDFPLRDLRQRAPQLRWIHITGAGIEPLLPLDWLPEQVILTNNSGVHADKIRESTAMMLLMLNTRLPAIISNQRKANWEQIFSPLIRGKTVLIIGLGGIGGAAVHAAQQLGLRIFGVRRSDAPYPGVERIFQMNNFDDALPHADFVLLAAPLTPETRRLMDRRRIGLMKKGSGFINIGRAGLADYDALADALGEGRISGAVLDVFDPEPLPPISPLWKVENLIMIPHVSSDDEDLYLPRTFDLVFKNVRRLAAGQELLNVVERERGY